MAYEPIPRPPDFFPYDPKYPGSGSLPSTNPTFEPFGGGPNFNFPGGGGGDGGGSGGGGGSNSWYNTTWGRTLINLGLGYATNKLLGGKTTEERTLSEFATAPYGSDETQRFLPPALRSAFSDPLLLAGMGNIGSLLTRPGGLSPNVAEAINPRLAAESSRIASDYRGTKANLAGSAARSNLPVSIRAALEAALDTQQERAQRGARGAALSESEDLRRRDTEQTYRLLDAILQFISSGRGQAIPGLSQAANMAGQRQAANMAGIASLLQNAGAY